MVVNVSSVLMIKVLFLIEIHLLSNSVSLEALPLSWTMPLGCSFPFSLQQLVEPTHLAKHVKRPVKKIMAAETLCSVYQIHMVVLVPQGGWD